LPLFDFPLVSEALCGLTTWNIATTAIKNVDWVGYVTFFRYYRVPS
jgi:hypothetical protein